MPGKRVRSPIRRLLTASASSYCGQRLRTRLKDDCSAGLKRPCSAASAAVCCYQTLVTDSFAEVRSLSDGKPDTARRTSLRSSAGSQTKPTNFCKNTATWTASLWYARSPVASQALPGGLRSARPLAAKLKGRVRTREEPG